MQEQPRREDNRQHVAKYAQACRQEPLRNKAPIPDELRPSNYHASGDSIRQRHHDHRQRRLPSQAPRQIRTASENQCSCNTRSTAPSQCHCLGVHPITDYNHKMSIRKLRFNIQETEFGALAIMRGLPRSPFLHHVI